MGLHWKCDRCGGWDDNYIDNVTDALHIVPQLLPANWVKVERVGTLCALCTQALTRWLKRGDES